MKIHEYNEMMSYLTRPAMAYGGRIGFELGGNVELKKYLSQFKKGATIDTDTLAKKIAEIYNSKNR